MFWNNQCDDIPKTGVIVQLKEKHVPFLLDVDCVVHQTNLVV
jgi:hypothetical protein